MKKIKKSNIFFVIAILFIFAIMPNKALATYENQEEICEVYEVDLIDNNKEMSINEFQSEIQKYKASSTSVSFDEFLTSEILKGSSSIDVSKYGINRYNIESYVELTLELHPEAYIFSDYKVYLNNQGTVLYISPVYFIDIVDIDFYYKKAEFMADTFIATIPEDSTELEQLLYIHNYICENTEYDFENLNELPVIDHSMYGLFINGVTVCDGYSNAFTYLCNKLGIECYLVVSENMDHAWNEVKIGDDYYHIDSTWDDTGVADSIDIYGRWTYEYFLLSDSQMLVSDHYDWEYSYVCNSSIYDKSFIHQLTSPVIEYENNWFYIDSEEDNNIVISVVKDIDFALQKENTQVNKSSATSFEKLSVYPTIMSDGIGILYTNGKNIYRIMYSSENLDTNSNTEIYTGSDIILGLRIYNGRFQIQTTDYNKKEITIDSQELSIDTANISDRDFNEKSLSINKAYKLKIASKLSDGECIWNSSNPNVATIDNNGVLKIVGSGFTNITLTQGSQVRTMLICVRDYINVKLNYNSSRATVYINGAQKSAGTYIYPKQSTLNINITLNSNYQFSGWIINGKKTEYVNMDISNLSEDIDLVAKAEGTYTSHDIENLIFDYKYYADNYSDLKNAFGYNETALKNHYISCGIKEGRIASKIFDVKYYINNNDDLKKAFGNNYEAAYNHFITYGWKEGRASSNLYYGSYYGNNYKDLILLDNYDLMAHFINFGIREGRKGTNLADLTPIDITGYIFDATFYADLYPDLRSAFGYNEENLRKHYINFGIKEGRIASVFFDPKYYLNKYSDLKNAFGNNYEAAYNHYINNGINEGRTASMYFDANYYLNKYSDLKSAFGNNYSKALQHFSTNGIREGREASSSFKISIYKSNYSDLRNTFGNDNIRYFIHYEVYGKNEGRKAY
jgi:transglutaminase-like putative cysteine protease